jgi:hypothetical protein
LSSSSSSSVAAASASALCVKEAYGGGEAIEGGKGWIDIWGRIEEVRLGGAMITHPHTQTEIC